MASSATPEARPSPVESHGLFWAWVILFLGAVGICLKFAPNRDHFWLWWEIATLITTTLYTSVFYVRLFFRKNPQGKYLYDGIDPGNLVGVFPFLCGGSVLFLTYATVYAAELQMPPFGLKTYHGTIWCIFLATLCFCAVDFLLMKYHSHPDVTREFRQGLFLNGIPVFFAFLTLLLFVYRFDFDTKWDMSLRAFLGGAIALEMLVSNTVFAILFYKPREL